MEQIGILTRSAKPSYARSACSNDKSNAHNFIIKQHIALHFMIAVFALLLNLQEKMIDLDARSQFCRQLCHSNDHPSKTQSIHHRLLVMLFTLSSVLASLKKFREEEFECPVCLNPAPTRSSTQNAIIASVVNVLRRAYTSAIMNAQPAGLMSQGSAI